MQLKWTDKPSHSRDLLFIIGILGFGVMLVAKLAPYYQDKRHSLAYSAIQTIPNNTPKEVVEKLNGTLVGPKVPARGRGSSGWPTSKLDRHAPSVAERPLFDGQSVILKVRSLNPFSSKEQSPPIEATIISPVIKQTDGDIDFSAAEGAKLVGIGNANTATKRLYLSFSELVSREGRSYQIQGQAIHPETLTAGIEGDYSSGLPLRLLGVAIDRVIMAGDQVGMAHLFSAIGPVGAGGQEFKKAAMETNQQASQNISAEATKEMRETPAEISLPVGYEFYVRVRTDARGIQQ